jgi:hypothetical protein
VLSFHVCLGSPLVGVLLEAGTAFFSCVPGFTTGRCIIRGRNCFLFTCARVHPQFLVGFVLLIFLVFCIVFIVLFRKKKTIKYLP